MALEPMGSVGRHLVRSLILRRLSSPPLWNPILNSLHSTQGGQPSKGEEPLLPTTTTTTLSHTSSSSFTSPLPHPFPHFLSHHPFLKQDSCPESRTDPFGLFSDMVRESRMELFGFPKLVRTEIWTPPCLPLGVVDHSSDLAMEADSVKRKRRKKMNKHKHRKLRRRLRKTKKR